MAWRFFATRLIGDGHETVVATDVPITQPQIAVALCAPHSIRGTITPEVLSMRDPRTGRPILEPQGTGIYAERDGKIVAGGILKTARPRDAKLELLVSGHTSYLADLAWTSTGLKFYDYDPFDIIRRIWQDTQSHPGGNVGLAVEPTKSPRRVGEKRPEVTGPDGTVTEPAVDEPFVLAKYATPNLLTAFNQLVEASGGDYAERHSWTDGSGSVMEHRLRLGYPRIGVRRQIKAEIGVDVTVIPEVDLDADDYASEVVVYGAGEGPLTLLSHAVGNPVERLRTVRTFTRADITTKAGIDRHAAEVLKMLKSRRDDITGLTVRGTLAALLDVGDEFAISGNAGWAGHIDEQWVRILGMEYRPDDTDDVELEVERADKVTP